MFKKISTIALVGLLALPAMATAGSVDATSDMAAQIDRLTKELANLKAQMAAMKEGQGPATDPKAQKEIADLKEQMKALQDNQKAAFDDLDERSAAWDLASRFQLFGDFRARGDWYKNDLVTAPLTHQSVRDILDERNRFAAGDIDQPTFLANVGQIMGNLTNYDKDEMENTSLFTNRFRLNMNVKATENVDFKGRLAMYKTWGTSTLPPNITQFGYPSFDGTSTREPSDNILRVDRAFVNWNNIAGQPIWFSIGRRPTTDGPAAQLRMGLDERLATPTAYMDWPFDGISVGYAYANLFGMPDAPGRVRVCYGRGFENGLLGDDGSNIDDTDFAGVSWDIYNKASRFVYLQSFMVFNAFNFPQFDDNDTNVFYEDFFGMLGQNGRENVGNLLHTSAVYMDKWQKLNYFVEGGWSRTMPDDDTGMFNDIMPIFAQLQGQNVPYIPNDDSEDGYNVWLGVRYDMDDLGLKFGLEYNHGSQYWVGMTPGHDDLYSAKLATRGDVYEAYLIWDLPTGEAISKFAKTFMRFGYQHYDYDYSGGSDWNIKPYDIDKAEAENYGLLVPTIEDADQVYVTFEVYF
jgi:ribosomal protein L29